VRRSTGTPQAREESAHDTRTVLARRTTHERVAINLGEPAKDRRDRHLMTLEPVVVLLLDLDRIERRFER